MNCILNKCSEYHEGTFRFYCRLRDHPVNKDSICKIKEYNEEQKERLLYLFKLEDYIINENYNSKFQKLQE